MDIESIEQFEQGSPIRLVAKLNRLNLNSLREPLAEIGFARGMLPFFMEVLCGRGVAQEDISRSLAVDQAATARTMRQLEEGGFVRRVEDPANRRRKLVHTTGKGCAMRDRVMEILARQKDTLFAGFDEEERSQCLVMLERMIDNLLAAQT